MKQLRLASFGIRGYIGEAFTPGEMVDFAAAFGTFVDGGRVLVGRDTRGSSDLVRHAVLAGLLSEGCEVLDYGICPTPMLQFAVKGEGADGAVSISGGHTGMGWNAITLIGREGAFLDPLGGQSVLDFYHGADFGRPEWSGMGARREVEGYETAYFDALTDFVDSEAIRSRELRVVVDPVGGAGCRFLDGFAARFGLRLVKVNGTPSAYLAREPEPRPRTAQPLSAIMEAVRADAGFVFSSDLGRMSLVSEIGEPVSEEYTFPLIANHTLARRRGTLVTNVCTTRTVDEIAAYRDSPVHKTPVGQAHIVSALADEEGVIGGEGSGSVAVPAFSQAFDGFLMAAIVLEAMVLEQCALSELLHALPRYHIVKRRVRTGGSDAYRMLRSLQHSMQSQFPGASTDWVDGLRVDTPDGWMHARISRTEQAVRIISEATDQELAETRAEEAVQQLERRSGRV